MQRFQSKVVIITGAGSGIGSATASRLHHEGASLVLAGRNRDKLVRAAGQFDPARVHIATADISQEEAAQHLVESAIDRFGRLDVLVNNAGIGWAGRITDETAMEEWTRLRSTNVDGVIFAARAALPRLAETKGCIVNVSSVAGLRGDWGMSLYNASKGAVSNFSRALALDAGAQGVCVNAVCPTYIVTDMSRFVTDNRTLVAKFEKRIPLGRGGTPEDVAGAVAFLASDDARFITGVNLPVDGGVTASTGQPNLLDA